MITLSATVAPALVVSQGRHAWRATRRPNTAVSRMHRYATGSNSRQEAGCCSRAVGRSSESSSQLSSNPEASSRRLPAAQAAQTGNLEGAEDPVAAAQLPQLQATDLLASLVKASNLEAAVEQHVELLSEEFFMVASTYMDMARKEGENEVADRLAAVLKVAMDAKNKMLRPEIRLLNQLLSCEGDSQARKRLLNRRASGEALISDDGYFFKLLDQVMTDVQRQPDNPQKARLLLWLGDIEFEAKARLQPK